LLVVRALAHQGIRTQGIVVNFSKMMHWRELLDTPVQCLYCGDPSTAVGLRLAHAKPSLKMTTQKQ
jgi:hypothetical protein